MSYVSFAKNIVIPYKVNITGWPDDIPCSYPQHLSANHTKRLYKVWNGGGAHWYRLTAAEARSYEKSAEKNGELEPRTRRNVAMPVPSVELLMTMTLVRTVPQRRDPSESVLLMTMTMFPLTVRPVSTPGRSRRPRSLLNKMGEVKSQQEGEGLVRSRQD